MEVTSTRILFPPPDYNDPLSPITSIYPLPFFFFVVPFRDPPVAGPSKSSILLALLMLVLGRLGGALGGPPAADPLLTLLTIAGGAKFSVLRLEGGRPLACANGLPAGPPA